MYERERERVPRPRDPAKRAFRCVVRDGDGVSIIVCAIDGCLESHVHHHPLDTTAALTLYAFFFIYYLTGFVVRDGDGRLHNCLCNQWMS